MNDPFEGLEANFGWQAITMPGRPGSLGVLLNGPPGSPLTISELVVSADHAQAQAMRMIVQAVCRYATLGYPVATLGPLFSQLSQRVHPISWKGFKHIGTALIQSEAYCHLFEPVGASAAMGVAWIDNGDVGYIDRPSPEELQTYVVDASDLLDSGNL